ncbi:GNAT family N-acetyltransferase [Pseudorhodoplanes sinuspersici]|uniref:GNAT family N-acetyltransferase n=1 Tax=Pseudorhodoplanes sinuspersici TaxID=1235591 RepID=A0A1W6ZZZ8_9HYPH|nr:N-acetyltransferase [Pseudorhodoplanes sinuspersici]ARQ02936.1 GNAT family N-acetyltransferase [Pseudorhodoplanes sinuspersici]RKE70897.1 putative N-acetyltransferase YhbS [Pseudorhodoplanes sinuspersici]
MTAIRQEKLSDFDAREALLDRAYGPSRFTKTSQRLREDRLAAAGLSFVATDKGQIIGSVRLWDVCAGPGKAALLLGPLAVAPEHRSKGLGGRLMKHAIAAARMRGHGAILLVGDAPYYQRFGFSTQKTGSLWMPGAYEQHRLLGIELQAGALDGARGLIGATGRLAPKPDLHELVAAAQRAVKSPTSRAA